MTGPEAKRAGTAALSHLRGGRVTAVERESEGGAAWEVEIARPDGSSVDVLLDGRYRVVGVEGDTEAEDESDGAEDDD